MKVFFPWNNLGCLGVQIGGFYADVYRTHRRFPVAAFVNWFGTKYWISAHGIRREG